MTQFELHLITERMRWEYQKAITPLFRDPDGALHDPYLGKFFRDPTPEEARVIGVPGSSGGTKDMFWHAHDWGDGQGFRSKVHFLPEGWTRLDGAVSERTSFALWASDEYGWPILFPGEKADPEIDERTAKGWVRVDAFGEVVEIIKRQKVEPKKLTSVNFRKSPHGMMTRTEVESLIQRGCKDGGTRDYLLSLVDSHFQMPPAPPTVPEELTKAKFALELAQRLCQEALPKFNWGASALDANAINLLNTVPGEIQEALRMIK